MATTPVDQVRLLDFTDAEPQTAMGFNSDTLVFPGTALTFTPGVVDPSETGQVVFGHADIVTSHEELMNQIGASVAVTGRYGLASASVKAQFANQTGFNSTSTFVLAQALVANPILRGQNFRLTDVAANLIQANNTDEFKTAFGDSFVRGIKSGGEFFAVFRLTSIAEETQQSLAATLSAEINGLVAGGSFDSQFSTASQDENERAEVEVSFYQAAGSGPQASITLDVADIFQRLTTFPTIAKASPFAFKVEVATYNTIPLPTPTPVEDEDYIYSMTQDEAKKLDYIKRKNDVDFAVKNPEFFINLPGESVLQADSETYVQLINAVMDHQVRLSKGQFSTPQVFDPAKLNPPLTEPPPRQFTRKPPTPSTTPDLSLFVGAWQNTNSQGPLATLIVSGLNGGVLPTKGLYRHLTFPHATPLPPAQFPAAGYNFDSHVRWYGPPSGLQGGILFYLGGPNTPPTMFADPTAGFGPIQISCTYTLQRVDGDSQRIKVLYSEAELGVVTSPPNVRPGPVFTDVFIKTAS